MTHEPTRIHFEDFVREVQAIFDLLASQKEPFMVERAGRLFRLEAEHRHELRDIWAGYDPDRVRQALRKSA